MKTPRELYAEEEQRLIEEKRINHLESRLENMTATAIKEGKITSAGGTIDCPIFSGDIKIFSDYFTKYNWNCEFKSQIRRGMYTLILTPKKGF